MTKRHIMLDLETLSLESNAAIVSIGAVEFEPNEINFCYKIVDIGDSIKYGHVDASTIKWWMNQPDKTRAIFGAQEGAAHSLSVALGNLSAFMHGAADVCVWGNGAAFDNVVLRNAYKAVGIKPPWSYKNDRCYRTFAAQHSDIESDRLPDDSKHNALNDAMFQVNHMIKILRAKGLKLS